MVKETKLFLFLLFGIVLFLSVTSAVQEELGTFKTGEDILLIQLCGTCSSNNITSVTYPNSSNVITNKPMVADGSRYTYLLDGANITVDGTYKVNGIGDKGGTAQVWSYEFEVTPTGRVTPEGVSNVYGIIVLIIFGISIFFLYLSTQIIMAGPKIFCLLISLIFLAGSLLIGTSFIQTYNIVEGLSNNVSYMFYALGLIIFISFVYVLIRQVVVTLELMQMNKGLKYNPNDVMFIGGQVRRNPGNGSY